MRVQRDLAVRAPQRFLYSLHVFAVRFEKRCEGVSEYVPTILPEFLPSAQWCVIGIFGLRLTADYLRLTATSISDYVRSILADKTKACPGALGMLGECGLDALHTHKRGCFLMSIRAW